MATRVRKKEKKLVTLTPEALDFLRELKDRECRTFSEVLDEIVRAEHRRRAEPIHSAS